MMPSYRFLKKKDTEEKEKKSIPQGSYTASPNYKSLAAIEKPETFVDFEKVPEVKKIINEILKEDRSYWKKLNQPTQGIEKYILLNKVCNKLPINSDVFEIALDELIVEQSVVPMELDNKIRFLKICL